MFSVIFDMDGTLLDTQRICIPAWEHSGKLQGVNGLGEVVRRICGMNEIGWTAYLQEHFPTLDIVAFKAEMREYIIKNGTVRFKDGAKELLEYLKSKGIKCAIASGSSRKTIEQHLNEVNATHYFEAAVGGIDVKNGKPAPDIFLLAAEKLGANPCDCFVFEDSPNGMKAGFNAGMKCIGVPDIVTFSDDTKKMMFAELTSLDQAIEIFEKL